MADRSIDRAGKTCIADQYYLVIVSLFELLSGRFNADSRFHRWAPRTGSSRRCGRFPIQSRRTLLFRLTPLSGLAVDGTVAFDVLVGQLFPTRHDSRGRARARSRSLLLNYPKARQTRSVTKHRSAEANIRPPRRRETFRGGGNKLERTSGKQHSTSYLTE